MQGRIHSIESFSTVDGPGIRYVVFMQGCKLRCKFCHNPDTWETDSGNLMSVDELLEKILSVKEYLVNSNGGVTFTGGEPLLQIDFLLELCPKLKKNGVHIAIDTAGNFDYKDEKLNKLLPYVDLFLYDIKHIDNDQHKKLTGVSNSKILALASYLSNVKKIPMWIRVVYIPGITDIADSLDKYKEFISTLNSVCKVEVLPYHEMGKYKWKELGILYELTNMRIPTEAECERIHAYITK
ncbi:MAG: pyruvate formate-lyase-activating protein [Clostridia bacterium]|nr:pyruvate formate-lyase-activating protein [Clostridia bacterium]